MQPIVTDVACSVVCVSVCLLVTWTYYAKMAETTPVGPRNHVLNWDQDPFAAARSYNTSNAAFCQITLDTY